MHLLSVDSTTENATYMQTVGLSNSRKKDRRSNNRDNFPRHLPGYSKDGTTASL